MHRIHQITLLAFSVWAISVPALAKTVNVVLVAGQSNASGRATTADLPSSSLDMAIEFFYDTDITGSSTRLDSGGAFLPLAPPGSTFGPEMALGRVLSQKGTEDLAIIKVTRGGTNLRTDWEKGNTSGDQMYSLFIDTVTEAFDVLDQRGDTINVLGMAWHQGEGDAGNERNNPGNYQTNLTQFIGDVRGDLSLPDLPFLIGGVFEPGREELYAAQQATAAAVANASFISSTETSVFDMTTHFDGRSQLLFGTRFANALTLSGRLVEFEQPNFDVGPSNGQNGWVSHGSSEDRVVSTLSSGSYVAGQAAGHPDSGGLQELATMDVVPVVGNSMSADFFAGDATDHDGDGLPDYDDDGLADSSVRLYGWTQDTNDDGYFSRNVGDRRSIGFGLDNDGTINLRLAGDGSEVSTGVNYDVDNWYKLTLSWTHPDLDGNRDVSLFAEDLTGEELLNDGNAIFSMTLTADQFGDDPSQWIGTGIRATRGLVDNIQIAAPGDFDRDGDVDGADLNEWESAFGGLGADADRDGDSDGTDFLTWQQQFGSGINMEVPALSAVPEPSGILLSGFALAYVLGTSRRKR